jgi:hypothetical protein
LSPRFDGLVLLALDLDLLVIGRFNSPHREPRGLCAWLLRPVEGVLLVLADEPRRQLADGLARRRILAFSRGEQTFVQWRGHPARIGQPVHVPPGATEQPGHGVHAQQFRVLCRSRLRRGTHAAACACVLAHRFPPAHAQKAARTRVRNCVFLYSAGGGCGLFARLLQALSTTAYRYRNWTADNKKADSSESASLRGFCPLCSGWPSTLWMAAVSTMACPGLRPDKVVVLLLLTIQARHTQLSGIL